MSTIAVPALTRGLTAFSAILVKAEQQPNFAKIEPALMQARLFPDMFALPRQLQIATDHAKGCVARLAGEEPPAYADDETSFSALRERLAKTLAFIGSVAPDRIDGSESRTIEIKAASHVLTFEGQNYLLRFALPNFYFHLATAYDILRHNGIPLSKHDFIGDL